MTLCESTKVSNTLESKLCSKRKRTAHSPHFPSSFLSQSEENPFSEVMA